LPPITLLCQSDQGRFVARMERSEIRDPSDIQPGIPLRSIRAT
jgi:hypothetical protein